MIKVRIGTFGVQVLFCTSSLRVRLGTHVYIHVPSVPSLHSIVGTRREEVPAWEVNKLFTDVEARAQGTIGESCIAALITVKTRFKFIRRERRREVDSDLGCG